MKSFLSRSVTLSINRNKETFKDTLLKKASPFCDTINIDEHSFKYIRTRKNLISFLPKVKGTVKEIGRDNVRVDVDVVPRVTQIIFLIPTCTLFFYLWEISIGNSLFEILPFIAILFYTVVYNYFLYFMHKSELHKTKTDFIIWFGGEVEVLRK